MLKRTASVYLKKWLNKSRRKLIVLGQSRFNWAPIAGFPLRYNRRRLTQIIKRQED